MWTCSKCQSQVEPTFDVCWNCGTSREGVVDPTFVTADDAPPIADPAPGGGSAPITGEIVMCYQAYSLIEAKFLADQLAEIGITATSDARDMQDEFGTLDGNPKVYCQEADLPRARAWLEAYEERRKAEGGPVLED